MLHIWYKIFYLLSGADLSKKKKNPFLFLEMLVGEQGGGDKGILEDGTLDQMNGRYSDLFFAIWGRISKTIGANVLHTKQCYFSQLNLH